MRLGGKACDQEEDWYGIVNYNIVPGPMVQRRSTCLGQEIKGTLFRAQYIHMYCISSKLNRDIRSGGQVLDEVGNSSNAIMHGREGLMKLSPRWDFSPRRPAYQAGDEGGGRREEGGWRMEKGGGRREEGGGAPEGEIWPRSRQVPKSSKIDDLSESGGGLVKGAPEGEIWPSSRRVPKSSKIDDLNESGGGLASGAPEKEIRHRKSLI